MSNEPRGLLWPLQFDTELGHLTRASGSTKMDANVGCVLTTQFGERHPRPQFGIMGMQLLFKNIDYATKELIKDETKTNLPRSEPRVFVRGVVVGDDKEGAVPVEVEYESRISRRTSQIEEMLR